MTPWETTRPIPRDPMKLVKSSQLPASLHFTMYESHSCPKSQVPGCQFLTLDLCAPRRLRPLYHRLGVPYPPYRRLLHVSPFKRRNCQSASFGGIELEIAAKSP